MNDCGIIAAYVVADEVRQGCYCVAASEVGTHFQNRVRQLRQTSESRKMAGRKMAIEAPAVFIFLPGIFLLSCSSSRLLQVCPDIRWRRSFHNVLRNTISARFGEEINCN
jgi:hypothetical protein